MSATRGSTKQTSESLRRGSSRSLRAGTNPSATSSADKPLGAWLLAIFALALVLRLFHLWQIRNAPFTPLLMGDAQSYDAWARRIARGEWIGTEVFYQAPLYPYFLGILYRVIGPAPMVARVVQSILGSLACLLLAAAGARLFSRRAGILAGMFLACYAPAIFFDGLIQKSALDLCLIGLLIWQISRMADPPDFGSLALIGLWMGALMLCRENAGVLPIAMFVWLLIAYPGRFTARLRAVGVVVAGLMIVLLPVVIRNAAVGHEFHLTTSQFGPNFYIGNSRTASGMYEPLRFARGDPQYERQDAVDLAERALDRPLSSGEVSHYWTQRTFADIRAEPARWLALLAKKFSLTWNSVEIADTETQEVYADWSIPLRLTGFLFHFGTIAPLYLLGTCLTWGRSTKLWLLQLMLWFYVGGVVLFYVMARYRYPMAPFLILFAAAGVNELLVRIRAPRRAGLIATAAGVLLAAVLCNRRIMSDRQMRSLMHFNVGNLLLTREGQYEHALGELREALKIAPDNVAAHFSLAVALMAANRCDESLAEYQHALALDPKRPEILTGYGDTLGACGRPTEAIERLREALAIDPAYAPAHNCMGEIRARQGAFAPAADAFRQAVASDPNFADAHRNLAQTLSAQGKRDEAIRAYQASLKIDPTQPETRFGLGVELTLAGRRDEGVRECRQALSQRPDAVPMLTSLCLILATHPNSTPADAPEAIRLAERAVELTQHKDAAALDALGAAYATAGQFDQAIAAATRAMELATANHDTQRSAQIQSRLALYHQHKPYRESPASSPASHPE